MMFQIIIFLLMVNQAKFERNLQNPCHAPTLKHGKDLIYQYRYTLLRYIDATSLVDVTLPTPAWLNRQFVYVNCGIAGLDHVPNEIPESAEVIDLSVNLIRHVSKESFRKWKNLTVLFLSYNCYTNIVNREVLPICDQKNDKQLQINKEAFLFNPNLKWLDLSSNFLNALPKLPESISVLDISATQLGNITNDLLANDFPNLTIFSGGFNCLSYFDMSSCWRNFTISSSFASSLQLLNLVANSLFQVPSRLLSGKLTSLFLSHNILTLTKHDFENAPNLKFLDLSHLRPNVGKICTKNDILEIPEGIFDPLTQLEILTLKYNKIQYIPKHLFKYNKNLKHLDLSLSSLGLQVMDPIFVQGLSNLRYLDLSASGTCYQSKVVVDVLNLSEVYTTLTSLESLLLGFASNQYQSELNKQRYYSVAIKKVLRNSFDALSGATKLNYVSIAGMSIKEIEEDSWSKLHTLQYLFATYNNLHSEHELHRKSYVEALTSLRFKRRHTIHTTSVLQSKQESVIVKLDYSHNGITNLSSSKLLFLHDVTHLDVSYNKIEQLNKLDFANLTKLVEVNLGYNPLHAIPSSAFQNLFNLQTLTLISPRVAVIDLSFLANLNSSNGVKARLAVPSDVVVYDTLLSYEKSGNPPFYQIIDLDLSGNKVVTSPPKSGYAAFEVFPNAKALRLENCGITFLPPKFFSGLKSLKRLSLQKNYLRVIPIDSIRPLTALEALTLNHNFITSVTSDKNNFFDHFKNLTYLSLVFNRITHISPGFFKNARLEFLDLSYNHIYSLNSSVLPPSLLPHLKFLDIRWNNLDCTCNAWKSFFTWYLSDSSATVRLPGFVPKCTPDIDGYFGGCVSCQSPKQLMGLSVSRFGDNSSCTLENMLAYSIAFSSFFLFFTVIGSVTSSKWAKRFVFQKVHKQFRVQSLSLEDAEFNNDIVGKNENVFIFFDYLNDELADWIDGTLVPRMVNIPPSVNLTLVGRDNPCGVTRTQHILRQITQSKKVVVFLTENFCVASECT